MQDDLRAGPSLGREHNLRRVRRRRQSPGGQPRAARGLPLRERPQHPKHHVDLDDDRGARIQRQKQAQLTHS